MMPAWFVSAVCPALVLALTACESGGEPPEKADFAILAQSADGYARARPGVTLAFPRDHGAHPDFRIEWWYLTANLEDPDGQPFGAQWTLFRLAVQPPGAPESASAWQSRQLYMGHFAITTPNGHFAFQRYSRGGERRDLARAGVQALPFEARLDDWVLRSTGVDWLPLEVKARQDDYAIQFDLHSEQPLVLQGDAGFSQKHPAGGGSHYYSQPFLTVRGALEVAGGEIPVTGKAWLDREWSSQFLQGGQQGWDWFSLHLESGEKLMLFQLRDAVAGAAKETFRYGVLIQPDGGTVQLSPEHVRLTAVSTTRLEGRNIPTAWRVELEEAGRTLDVRALHPDQWMDVDFPYWEGAITASGDGPENSGVGYMELTGYPAD
jgi:predicted secreted hydrolase